MSIELRVSFEALAARAEDCRVIFVDGLLGTGKSTLSRNLAEALPEAADVWSTDDFLKVTRADWQNYVERGEGVAPDWFDREAIRRLVAAFRVGKPVEFDNLYNLSNGRRDRHRRANPQKTPRLILEGLFTLEKSLAALGDLRVWVEVDRELAYQRTKERDYRDRNYTDEIWQRKEQVYWDGYLRYADTHKARADVVYAGS